MFVLETFNFFSLKEHKIKIQVIELIVGISQIY